MNLVPISDPLFYLVAVPAVLLAGIGKAGFGGGVSGLSVPLMVLVVPAPQAVAIMLPILSAMDLIGLAVFRQRFIGQILRTAIPAAAIGIALGALLFGLVDPRWITALIGIEAILFATQRLLAGRAAREAPPMPITPGRAWFWPAVSGFTSFTSHAGSPPMMQFMLPLRLDPVLFVGTLTWFFAFVNLVKWVPYTMLGLFNPTNVGTSLALMPVVPIGYFIGLRILRWIKPDLFLRVAVWALLLTGLKLCWDAFM